MNIKSDTNNHKVRNFFIKYIFEYKYNIFSIRLGLLIVFGFLGSQLWEFSGLLSLLSYFIGSIFFVFKDDNLFDKLFKIVIVFILLFWIGTFNAYYKKSRVINIDYTKKEFIDSTQKLVIYAVSPINEPLVLTFKDDKKYFSLKNSKSLTLTIIENKVNDHIDKLFRPNHIEEWKYVLNYKSDTTSGSIKDWKVSKSQLFKNIKAKK